MLFKNNDEISLTLQGILVCSDSGEVTVIDENRLRGQLVDLLVYNAVFNSEAATRGRCRYLLHGTAYSLGIYPASIQPLYEQKGKGKHPHFTVPAINIRGLTYDVAGEIFKILLEMKAGALIFEIARSEIGYTSQHPAEYTAAILAAAIRYGYSGPIFLQGDHFQVKSKAYSEAADREVDEIKVLIRNAVDAGFYNIDIDSSTMVNLAKGSIDEQQCLNYELCAMFTQYIRSIQPADVTVSVGGEIGEVGGKNSTPEELEAFMKGYRAALKKLGPDLRGISKISVQTGTTHGGVPLPDGTIARVNLDFATLEKLSKVARKKFGLAGAVQHGASTLPEELFHRFPEVGTAEIHLATAFQNTIFDHPAFPEQLRSAIYGFLQNKFGSSRKDGQTDEQFFYKNRKNAFGPFKQQLWDLPEEGRRAIGAELNRSFRLIFERLGIAGTAPLVQEITAPSTCRASLEREVEMAK